LKEVFMSCSCCEKRIYTSEKAPKAIGPYSPAVKANGFVFISGQLGLDPATGNLVEGGVEAETRQALTNLKTLVEAAGSDLSQVTKTTVFLRDIADFARMNSIYGEFFTVNPPARSAFQVGALPKGAAVEIEAIAAVCECECDCEGESCNCH
jgi:2-iminobutanoate/2-iminopropanoate deaminase